MLSSPEARTHTDPKLPLQNQQRNHVRQLTDKIISYIFIYCFIYCFPIIDDNSVSWMSSIMSTGDRQPFTLTPFPPNSSRKEASISSTLHLWSTVCSSNGLCCSKLYRKTLMGILSANGLEGWMSSFKMDELCRYYCYWESSVIFFLTTQHNA